MSAPRAGGETAKFGERYEGVWTVRQVLDVLFEKAESITVEPIDEVLSEGAEFTLAAGGDTQVHQVKRQLSGSSNWSISDLSSRGILDAAFTHVNSGRAFHFVSTIPARQLDGLAERARRSDSLLEFEQGMLSNSEFEAAFSFLSKAKVWQSKQAAWETLRRVWVSWPDERQLTSINTTLCEFAFTGENPELIPAALAEFLLYNTGRTLSKAVLRDDLRERYSLELRTRTADDETQRRVESVADRWSAGVDRELLNPAIPRSEASRLVEEVLTESTASQVVLISGDAGSGKSAVLRQAQELLIASGHAHVLPIRLDRVELSGVSTTRQLGAALDLATSPVTALASVCPSGLSVLILDQLDVVSLVSGRASQALDVVADLLREVEAYPHMRVIASCRSFDLENDYRIRALMTGGALEVRVGNLSEGQVEEALQRIHLSTSSFSQRQLRLLQLPLNLVLLTSVADEVGALDFETSKSLFDLYWQRKLRECAEAGVSPDEFVKITFGLASRMSDRQRLALPTSQVPDELKLQADKLVSAHVLVLNESKWAFFHESFFDYVFAKNWLRAEDTLVKFLLRGEQELFRRAQVRQILTQLRDDDIERFVDEFGGLLSEPRVRFHIKALVLVLASAIASPTHEEWLVLSRFLESNDPLQEKVVRTLCSPGWFLRLSEENLLEAWLRGSGADQTRAINVIRAGVRDHSSVVAVLLNDFRSNADYGKWISWLIPVSDLAASRQWFELVLDAIQHDRISSDGHAGLWASARRVIEAQPYWGVELLRAYFGDSSAGRARDDGGRFIALKSHEPLLMQFIDDVAIAAPREMASFLVPYVLEVCATTAYADDSRPLRDAHFSFRIYEGDVYDIDGTIFRALTGILTTRIGRDEQEGFVEQLASDPHDAAQFLLYKLLQVLAPESSHRAAQILLEGTHRFECGYMSDTFWETRQLLQRIANDLADAEYCRLEDSILQYRPHDDSVDVLDYGSFELLSALPESRMSSAALQMLEEARARYGDQPETPTGIVGGIVGSPIPLGVALGMSDDEWRDALVRYATDRGTAGSFTGGAIELGRVLGQVANSQPERILRILTEIATLINPEYIAATLRALAEEDSLADPSSIFDFILTAARLGDPCTDRWLGFPLRKLTTEEIPPNVTSALVDRMLRSPDPGPDETDAAESVESLRFAGINSARGALADCLGDLLLTDKDGSRAALVLPFLENMSRDPSNAVRSSVAHLITASLRHDEIASISALKNLVANAEQVLATNEAAQMVMFAAQVDYDACRSIVESMLRSELPAIATNGGAIAAFLGLEMDRSDLFAQAADSPSEFVRLGVARTCSSRILVAKDRALTNQTLVRYFNDDSQEVRDASAHVVSTLRDTALAQHETLLRSLFESQSFDTAQPQLWITFERATDSVTRLFNIAARRFLDNHGSELADFAARASMDARTVCELVLRAYAEAADGDNRAEALSLIDDLVRLGALDIDALLVEAER